jgi:hypothetical protein
MYLADYHQRQERLRVSESERRKVCLSRCPEWTDRQATGQGKPGETTVRTSDKQRGDLSVVGAAAVTFFTAGCGVVSVLGCDET